MSTMRRFGLLGVGSAAAVLLSGCLETNPVFSPDGRGVLVQSPKGPALLATDGSGRRTLPAVGGWPMWSPDGRWMVWLSGNLTVAKKKDDLRLVLYDTVCKGMVVLGTGCLVPVAWREDSRRLAAIDVTGTDKNVSLDLVQYSIAERGAILRTHLDAAMDIFVGRVFWVPNTDNLAYVGIADPKQPAKTDVYYVDCGEPVRITHTGDVIGLAVSSDGRHLYWGREPSKAGGWQPRIWRFDLGTRDAAKLPLRASGPRPPAALGIVNRLDRAEFSPDMRFIAVSGDSPTGAACWICGSDGAFARRLDTSQTRWGGMQLAWSADSSKVAVQCVHDGWLSGKEKVPSEYALYVYDAETWQGRRLYHYKD